MKSMNVQLPSRLPMLIITIFLLSILNYPTQTNAEISDFTPCPGMCSGQGHCDHAHLQCECFEGFFGTDCSLRRCPFGPSWADISTATDTAHNLAECSNRGICDRQTGQCSCEAGRFEGRACERMTCRDACSGFGRCESIQSISSLQDPGELITSCSTAMVCVDTACATRDYSKCTVTRTYTTIWDAKMIYGCVCDDGYSGPTCATRTCPTGDDPLTGTAADTYVSVAEKQILTCMANGGTFTLTYRGATTANIEYSASASELVTAINALHTIMDDYDAVSAEKGVGVTYTGSNTQACTDDGNSITVLFTQNFGNIPLIIPDGSKLTHSVSIFEPLITSSESVIGTKEDVSCGNRGVCDTETGVCTCSLNFDTSDGYGNAGQRGDCGRFTTPVTTCPGEIACSAQGVCAGPPTYVCLCKSGYTGADCSELVCSKGRNWFGAPLEDEKGHQELVECSGAGDCDREAGICTCIDGFEGGACERMMCPGDPACNGRGECLSMSKLAEKATDNGDAVTFTYGAIPNDAATWDFDKVQGCYCGEGYEGYDCSLLSCPYGDDPISTVDQNNEVQSIFCQESTTDGSFTLTFRQQKTVSLAYDAKVGDVKVALEALSNLFAVNVYLGDNLADPLTTPICSASGTLWNVEFLSPTGDVPKLQGTTNLIEEFLINEVTKGTKEFIECSGRGLCDHETGLCECVAGFASSNGRGEPGLRNDCGYKTPIVVVAT